MHDLSKTGVDVVIPCYNSAQYLAESVQSALNQSISPREIIIVDDGSTDESLSIAESFPNVKVISQTNSGVSVARNSGMSLCTASYIIFLDADDKLFPNAIRDGKRALDEDHRRWMAYGGNDIIDSIGNIVGTNDQSQGRNLTAYQILTGSNPIPSQSMIRRSALELSGPFKPDLTFMEDQELWLRLNALGGELYCHGHRVASYRRHSMQSTMSITRNYKIRQSLNSHLREITKDSISSCEWKKIIRYEKLTLGEYFPFELFRQIRFARLNDMRGSISTYAEAMPYSIIGSAKTIIRKTLNSHNRGNYSN